MNTPSPLVPQGTIPAGKSTLRVAVFTILVLHVALIGGFLFQGCSKKEPQVEDITAASTDTNAVDSTNSAVAPLDNSNSPVAVYSNAPVEPVAIPTTTYVAPTAPVLPVAPVAPVVVTVGNEYIVVKGDTLATIAKKHGISLKALEEANPGVDSKKLHLKQKLQIPGGAGAPTVALASTEATASAEGTFYTVKAGDALAKIAKQHGVSVSAIVACNNLKSKNAIKPGQKLRMPAPKVAAVSAAAPAAVEAPVAPAMATPAPMAAPVVR